MSIPSFDDIYEKFSSLVEDGFYTGRYHLKSKTVSTESGVTWKAKIHDEGGLGNDVLGKIAFGFSSDIPDVMQSNMKSSLRTDGRVRSKLSVTNVAALPNTSFELAAEVNTATPKAEDNLVAGVSYEAPFYTVTGEVKVPGDPAADREFSCSGVAGLNGVLVGCKVQGGGDYEYAAGYFPEGDWCISAMFGYQGETLRETKVAFVHQIAEGLGVGAEYVHKGPVSVVIEKAQEETGLTMKGRADSTGALGAVLRQRVAPGLYLGAAITKEDRTATPKVTLQMLFERT